MAHMVIFRTTDGKPAYHQTEALDDAVRFVEHLRNEEQVTDARIFTMSEVPIEFKVQWRVEVATPIIPSAVVPPVEPIEPSPFMAPEAAPEMASAQADDDADMDDEDELDDEPVPVAVGGGESLDGETLDEGVMPAPPTPSAASRFGLFSRG